MANKSRRSNRTQVGSRAAIERVHVINAMGKACTGATALVLDSSALQFRQTVAWLQKFPGVQLYVTLGVVEESARARHRQENLELLQDTPGVKTIDVDTSCTSLPLERIAENELLRALSYALPKTIYHRCSIPYLEQVVELVRPMARDSRLNFPSIKSAVVYNDKLVVSGYEKNIDELADILAKIARQAKQTLPIVEDNLAAQLPVRIDLKHYRNFRGEPDYASAKKFLVGHTCIGVAKSYTLSAVTTAYDVLDPTKATDRKQLLAAQMLVKELGRDNREPVYVVSHDSDIKLLRRLRFHTYKKEMPLASLIIKLSSVNYESMVQQAINSVN